MANITLYELGNYNGGNLVAHTFELDTLSSYEEWLGAVHRWLMQLTEKLGQLCEEWIVADAEGVPGQFVGEYHLDPSYWTYREAVDSSYLDETVFIAAAELDIPTEMVDELYQGEYSNDEDFAYSMAEDLGVLDDGAQWPHSCIDWEHASRELMYDYGSSAGHYFRTAY